MSNPAPRAPIAVAIPCYNEAAALAQVIAEWRTALPEAEIVVFDNNSTDGSGAIAREHGARVVPVPEQGKGHVVRAIFATLAECEAVVMIDGDGTYPAAAVGPLLEPILCQTADMAVGVRRPVDGTGALTPTRWLGNLLIRSAFWVCIGRGHADLLSGYRVFSRVLLQSFQPRSGGFEIETELACAAVARRLRVATAPVPYHPRATGTTSKLRAFRDGLRILATIVREGLRLRPWRTYLAVVAVTTGGALLAGAYMIAWAFPVVWIPIVAAASSLVRRPGVPAFER